MNADWMAPEQAFMKRRLDAPPRQRLLWPCIAERDAVASPFAVEPASVDEGLYPR